MVFGGLNKKGAPLGDVVLLKPNGLGFTWETLEVQPSPVSRSVTNQQIVFHWQQSTYPHSSASGDQDGVIAPPAGDDRFCIFVCMKQ